MFAFALIAALFSSTLDAAPRSTSAGADHGTLDFTYHDHSRMTAYLHEVADRHKDITNLYSIGKSVEGQDLWVLELSTAPPNASLVPNVKLVANIHGNEPVGRELLLHLIEELTTKVGTDEYITWLLNNSRVHLLPSLNPDGFKASTEGNCEGPGRQNKNGQDLNRNFPDHFESNNAIPRQPETVAIQKWLLSRNFVLSGGLHGGAVVASYPYDNMNSSVWEDAIKILNETNNNMTIKEIWKMFREKGSGLHKESRSPDDDVFRHLALTYSRAHGSMSSGTPCKGENKVNLGNFPDGIVNGAKWYPFKGGMQDYNYFEGSCLEVTLEVSCCKYPKQGMLEDLWGENKKALLRYLGQAQRGIRGVVLAKNTGSPIEDAQLNIAGREVTFKATARGEFWRILMPGYYQLLVTKDGFKPAKVAFTVPEQKEDEEYPTPVELQVNMSVLHPPTEVPGLVTSETSSSLTSLEYPDYSTGITAEKDATVTVGAEYIDNQAPSVLPAISAAKTFIGEALLVLAFGIVFLML